jgi:hypothetical protein
VSGVLQSIRKILTLRCEEAADLLSAAQDGSLSLAERWALRMHLLVCRPCRRFRRQLALLRDVLRQVCDQVEQDPGAAAGELSPAARGRLQRLVEESS